MTPRSPVRRALDLAAQQHGVIARRQILGCGVSVRGLRELVRGEALEPLHRAVFRATGSPRTWRQHLVAAIFAGGPGAVASHRATAQLFGLDGFDGDHVEIAISQERRVYRAPRGVSVALHRTSILDDADTTTVGCIPTMTVTRMLICLGAVVDDADLVRALDAAERRGLVHRPTLVQRLTEIRASGRTGVRAIARILETRERLANLPTTTLERHLMDAIRRAGLPLPETQYPFARPGRRSAFLDFAWPEFKIAVEADSTIAHALPLQRASDNKRDRDVERRDWRVLRFTYEEIMYATDDVVAEIADHLRSRGAQF